MRLAFYAPLKPPDHPVPSGDRRMAQLLVQAWEQAGHQVELASRLASRRPEGADQREVAEAAALERAQLLARYAALPPAERPAAWFTYHLYYKAPDWLGPDIARALAIPYLVAEASVAGKRAGGPHAMGHDATAAALRAAARVFVINPADREGLEPLVALPHRLVELPAFLDLAEFSRLAGPRAAARRTIAARHGLDAGKPWLLTVAMMRPGDKLASYRILGQALAALLDLDWQLLLVGDGPARPEVEAALAPLGAGRVCYLGRLDEKEVAGCHAAADLCLWPAVNEAYGMALLEAQAAGLPVVAGAVGGVPSIVTDGITGLLTPPGEVGAFAAAARALIVAPARRAAMAVAAAENVRRRHDIATAAAILDRALVEACAETCPGGA
ncbi:MAG TPA: glycosyltransferase family 4 protein [Dongiaceae bacterium]|jgi:glycosyltransferase involved in cell wall biosynthesis